MQQAYPNWLLKRPQWWRAVFGPGKPVYRLPYSYLVRVASDAVLGRKRDVWAEVRHMVTKMPYPPVVEGIENVPRRGTCVILPNHYERPDAVWVGWGVIAIAEALSRHREGSPPLRWVITSTWQDCYLGPRRIDPRRLTGILTRFAGIYDLILMPASDDETSGRSTALRAVFKALAEPDQILGLHPEAGGFESLIEPPKGIGRVLALFDRRGIPCVPVGVYEEDKRLHVRFGAPIPAGALASQGDREAAATVMRTIARLIPPRGRGAFADAGTEDAEEADRVLTAAGSR